MKIAYICHHGRRNYEYDWFAAMPVEKVVFVTTDASETSTDPKIEYRHVDYELKGWENKLIASAKDASTTPRVFYKDIEKIVDEVDAVYVLEVFSSLSRQFVEYCRKVGKPVIVLVYELIAEHPIYKIPRYSFNTRYVIKHADQFVTVSEAAGKHLRKLGADPQKISVIYPGIDLNIFKASRAKRKDIGLVFVGKLAPHKGIDQVVAIYPRLAQEFPGLPLTIVGDGAWQPQVEELVRQFPDSVSFTKRIPHNDLPQTLNKFGVYIMPARDTRRMGFRIGAEQFGFSIVEAMACGLAAITTECGALPEIVTDKNVVVAQDDTEALYRETSKLLHDSKRVKALGAYNEQLTRDRYNITTQAKALADVASRLATKKEG